MCAMRFNCGPGLSQVPSSRSRVSGLPIANCQSPIGKLAKLEPDCSERRTRMGQPHVAAQSRRALSRVKPSQTNSSLGDESRLRAMPHSAKLRSRAFRQGFSPGRIGVRRSESIRVDPSKSDLCQTPSESAVAAALYLRGSYCPVLSRETPRERPSSPLRLWPSR